MSDYLYAFSCPRCQVGVCKPTQKTYAFLLEDQMISVPDTFMHICDVCGFREIDLNGLATVQEMLHNLNMREYHESRVRIKPNRMDASNNSLKRHRPKT